MNAFRLASSRLTLVALGVSLLTAALSLGLARPASAQAITYTGQLLSGGTPVSNGTYDLQFSLYTAATGGSQVNSTVSVSSISVEDGVFYAEINLGNTSTGASLYLQTAYRKTGTTTYTTQSPRKLIPTTSYSQFASYSGSAHSLYSHPVSSNLPTTGQVLQWNGSLWLPTTLSAGTYTAGTGLTLSSNQFSVATGGITNSLLGSGAVTTSKLASSAVTNSILANGSVSGSKLSLPLSASASNSSDLFSLSNSSSGTAFTGTSSSGTGIKGIYSAASSLSGGYFLSGLLGDTTTGNGVIGSTSASGGYGVLGIAGSNAAVGVFGTTSDTSGTAVEGIGGNIGFYGSGSSYGVYGNGATGVYGNGSTNGVYGYNNSTGAYGMLGGSFNSGVFGYAGGSQEALLGEDTAASGRAIEGDGDDSQSGNYAGIFFGNVSVLGTLSKNAGSFKIDDPIDPAHKYLSHSFVESPDMMNIYNGNVTTDASGNATVTMPDYFEALNQDFRYQLTVIGQFAQAIVGSEMDGSQFTIKTDKPNVKVSWQVTGIRHDAWANAHRIPVEEDKPRNEQGLFLNPKEFGLPETQGIFQRHRSSPTLAQPAAPPVQKQQ